MPEITSRRPSCHVEAEPAEPAEPDRAVVDRLMVDGVMVDGVMADPVLARVHDARAGLSTLLAEADQARRGREESSVGDGGSAVCAWNHFENIPTFYNWNNRPR